MKIKLSDIRTDGGTQSRELISETTVQEYTEAHLNGATFPPIEVFDDGVNKWLVDGFHRYFMYMRGGVKEVDAVVHKGTNRDAVLFSLGVNDKHGLQRTNADKRKSVLTALNDIEWQDLSDRKIAEICRVSHAFVGKVKASLKTERPTLKEVTTKDGKTKQMETKNIGKKAEEPSEVNTLKTLDAMVDEIEDLTEDDHMAELAALNEELADENAKLHDNMVAMSDDQEKIANEFALLRSTIKALEAELRAVKSTSDEFQNKNAELIKQVTYWKKRAEKAEKVKA